MPAVVLLPFKSGHTSGKQRLQVRGHQHIKNVCLLGLKLYFNLFCADEVMWVFAYFTMSNANKRSEMNKS